MAYGMACISVPSVFWSSNLTGLIAIVFRSYISFSFASFSKLYNVILHTFELDLEDSTDTQLPSPSLAHELVSRPLIIKESLYYSRKQKQPASFLSVSWPPPTRGVAL